MRATLSSTYEELDAFVPDDIKIGDIFEFTAKATITEIGHHLYSTADDRSSCTVTLTNMKLARKE